MSGIQSFSSQLMTYPKDGNRKQGAKAGRWVLDFVNGLATDKDGNSEEISNNLVKIGKNFARSVFISVSTVDAIIKIGQNILPKFHQLTYVINGIGFEDVTIEFPTDRTPTDDFSFIVIASDADQFPIDADVLTGNHTPTLQTGTSVDAFTTIMDFLFTGYSQLQIISENILGVNELEITVQISEDGVNWVDSQGYPATIAVNDADIFQSSVAHRFLRVQIHAKVALSQSDFRVQAELEK